MTHQLHNPEAADLLFARLCDPRCLLAMDTQPGTPCSCSCGGRWHAALVFAPVLPQPWCCPECGAVAEDCARARTAPVVAEQGACCSLCAHPPYVLDAARHIIDELTATAS